MKVRCSACQEVVKAKTADGLLVCPLCGRNPAPELPSSANSTASVVKGKLPTQNRLVGAIGLVVVVFVLLLAGGIASAATSDAGSRWLVYLFLGAGAVAAGVWFQNKSARL